MTLAGGGSPIFQLMVHQPARPSSGQQCNHAGGACPQIRGAYVSVVEEMMCVVYVSVTRGHSGDGCNLASTLSKYDLRKGDLFVLSWDE